MTASQITAAIEEYKVTHPGVKYIRVILPGEVSIPVEVETISSVNNQLVGKGAGGNDDVGFQESMIVRFDPW
jgi:hypothetical protein